MFRNHASKMGWVGLALVAGAVGLQACSSSDSGTPANAGGTTAHPGAGGSSSSTAGTSSTTGGSFSSTAGTSSFAGTSSTAGSTGNPGTAGSGAGGAGSGFTCAGTKPTGALITDFGDAMAATTPVGQFTFMLGVPGGTFSYQPAALTLTTPGMALNVKGNVSNYDGFGIYFGACTDASAFTGVSFNIKGNVGTKGTLSFRFQTNADTAVDAVNKKGVCPVPAGTTDPYPICHAATKDITVTTGGSIVTVSFADVAGGVPVPTVDGKDILGLEWAFNWAGPTDTAYDADVTVDDIKFVGGTGVGGGGSGGSGGASGGTGGAAGGTGGASGGTGGAATGGGGSGGRAGGGGTGGT